MNVSLRIIPATRLSPGHLSGLPLIELGDPGYELPQTPLHVIVQLSGNPLNVHYRDRQWVISGSRMFVVTGGRPLVVYGHGFDQDIGSGEYPSSVYYACTSVSLCNSKSNWALSSPKIQSESGSDRVRRLLKPTSTRINSNLVFIMEDKKSGSGEYPSSVYYACTLVSLCNSKSNWALSSPKIQSESGSDRVRRLLKPTSTRISQCWCVISYMRRYITLAMVTSPKPQRQILLESWRLLSSLISFKAGKLICNI
ncbi:hypothetical protein BVRB_4g096450 [Beta vulgaris subsp. vulgaris]|uniref:Uncharacterized protein n=1 Tax=Beta vulgaris subsp. vulgaris TaxID=3555 RepID=A0A0J8BDK3_BETVV|nr:hypothetical protein BVRB_4g096450 [Beta vulgaris subsp. vulgaris]